MSEDVSPQALQIAVHDGVVLVFGPGEINLTFSAEDAEASAALLMQAAMAARSGKSGVVRRGAAVIGDDVIERATAAARDAKAA